MIIVIRKIVLQKKCEIKEIYLLINITKINRIYKILFEKYSH